MVVRIVKHAMEIIHLLTDANPIQIIVDAVINRHIILGPWKTIIRWCLVCWNLGESERIGMVNSIDQIPFSRLVYSLSFGKDFKFHIWWNVNSLGTSKEFQFIRIQWTQQTDSIFLVNSYQPNAWANMIKFLWQIYRSRYVNQVPPNIERLTTSIICFSYLEAYMILVWETNSFWWHVGFDIPNDWYQLC